MASGNSGSFTVVGSRNFSAVVYWSETYNSTANSHVVSIDAIKLRSTNWYGFTYFPQGSISVNGETVASFSSTAGSHNCTIHTQYDEYPIVAGPGYSNAPWSSSTIYGDADGSKSITISLYIKCYELNGKGGSGWVADGSSTVALYTIPRKSGVSMSNGVMGSATSISISRAASSFTHTLTYSFGNASGTIVSKTSATSVSWTPPVSLASQIPNSASGTCTVTCSTYSGSSFVGSTTVSASLSVPSHVKPSVDQLVAIREDGDVPSNWGIYVRTKSRVGISISDASGAYGSSITAYSISGGGYSARDYYLESGLLNKAGVITFTAKVQDSRGRWSDDKTISIDVVDYNPPAFIDYSSIRCNSAGTPTANGTYCKGKAQYSYSGCNGKNSISTAVDIKKSTEAYFTNTGKTFSSGASFIFGGSISPEFSYDVRYTLTDAFGSISVIETVSTASVLLDFKSGGLGIAVGKVAEEDKCLDIAQDWTLKIGSNKLVIGGQHIDEYFQQLSASLALAAHPVGSFYISENSTSPQTLFGGTWVRIKDRFLLAAGDSYTAGNTGGTKTHSHTTKSHTLTVEEIPSHYHSDIYTLENGSYYRNTYQTIASSYGVDSGVMTSAAKPTTFETGNTGGGQAHSHGNTGSANNMPPYLVVYVWKRTA